MRRTPDAMGEPITDGNTTRMTTRRRERTARSVLTVLMALSMVTSVMAPAVAYSLPANDGHVALDPGVETNTDATTNGTDDGAGVAESPVVSSNVRELVAAARSGGTDSALVSQSGAETRITVTVEVAPGEANAAADAVAAYGDVVSRFAGEIEASLPPGAVDAVADAPAVAAIRRPDPVVRTDRGVNVSEGLPNINATDARLGSGVNGSGVTVAVVDTGFDVGNDEIDDHVIEATDLEGDGIDNATGLHGTAVAELVVDTAPNVSLLLYEVNSGTQVGAAIRDIDRNTSADVASMSLGLLTGPFDGTSAIDGAIEDSVDNGTSWYVSAGNYADGQHYNGTWQDGDGDGWMNVSSTAESIDVSADGGFEIYVNWADENARYEDYDVYLNQSGTVVDRSTIRQDGDREPVEVVENASGGEYTLRIKNEDANGTADFDVFVNGQGTLTPSTSARSVARPATEETAVAVGAVYYGDDGLEGFSSRGPTVDGRTKPDLVAPDGVQTSQPGSSGLNPFFGTSAAAPHAAGVAALIIDRANVPLGPDRLAETLTAGATRLGDPVPNDRTGYGLVNASAPIAVTECGVIDEPGRYALTRDIATDVDDTCIDIRASNVTLDGDGHKIWHDDFGELSIYEAIEVTSVSNVTVRDLTVRYFDDAVEFYNVTDSAVVDLVSDVGTEFFQNRPSQSLGANGIVLRAGSDNNTIRSNDLYSVGDINDFETTGNGIFVRDSDNNTVADNVVSIPGNVGVRLDNASSNNVSANEIGAGGVVRSPGLAQGILVAADSDGNLVADNLLRGNSLGEQNGQTGIEVRTFGVGPPAEYAPSDHNRIVDNDIDNFAFDGISVFDNNATTILDNDIEGSNEYGIRVSGVGTANLTNNVVQFSGQTGGEANVLVGATNLTLVENDATSGYGDGVEIRDARSATIRNNTVGGNDGADFRLSNTTTLAVEDLGLLNYGVSFEGRNVSVSLNETGAVLPGSYEDVHLIDAGKTHSDGFANLTMSYSENRVTSELGLNESKLAFWNYTGNWSRVPEAAFDTDANTLAVNLTAETNLTAATTYAIAGVDDIDPTITAYSVTSSGTDLTTEFTASERLAGVLVEIRNGSGLQRTLRLDDFDLHRDLVTNTFDYSATTTLPEGMYTVELVNATDDAGNNASVTETKSATLDAFLAIESASLIDLEDGDGTVVDGDRVRISATIDGTDVRTVEANATRFGGSAGVLLSDQGNGVYNGTFTVDADADDSQFFDVNVTSGTFGVNVSVLDGAGRTATKRTNALTLDASLFIESASISDATNGDGFVTDGDTITVSATPGGTTVSSFVANASDFGGPDSVTLSDGDNDGTYTGSFTVGTRVAGNGPQLVDVTLTNDDGRTVSALTNTITVDVSEPIVNRITDSEVDDSLNVSRVRDGDVVFIKVRASDSGTGLDRVVANASAFGGPESLMLQDDGLNRYVGTFTVDAANAKPDGNYDLPVTAFDKVGASDTQILSLYMNNTGNSDPPVLLSPSANNLDGTNDDVRDGHRINVSVEASDLDGGVDTIYANASAFGAGNVTLSTLGPGFVYNATVVVDAANASADGDYDVEIVATDGFGNTANTTTNTLTLNASGGASGPDTTAPMLTDASITDFGALGPDFFVNDGDRVEVAVNVSDAGGSGIASVSVDASGFGAGTVTLTDDDDDDGQYNATFRVDAANAQPDSAISPEITATDGAGNANTTRTQFALSLDTTPPTASLTANRTTVLPGEPIEFDASGSTDPSPGRLDEHVWDFDSDGTADDAGFFSVGTSVTHAYSSAGTYTVTLNVTDDADNYDTTTATITVESPPDTTPPTLSNLAITDATDGNGVVSDGDSVTIAADAGDADSAVGSVTVDASALGAGEVDLTDGNEDGRYDAAFTVDAASAGADGTFAFVVNATDTAGNSIEESAGTLILDTTKPSIADVTATNLDGANDDIRDDDVIRITADVDDATNVSVTGHAGQFGVSEDVTMSDDDGDGVYEGAFTVNASAPSIEANGSTVSVFVSTTDEAGNTADATSNGLTLNYSTPDTDGPTGPTTDVRLEPASGTIGTGGTTTFDVVVANASGGVGAHNTTVSVADPTVARITDVQLAGAPGVQDVTVAGDNASVDIDAALMDTNDTGPVAVATVTIEANASGTTAVDLAVSALGNETGTDYVVNDTASASLTVTPVPTIGSFENAPTDPDGDGVYEDINGNGEMNVVDVQAMFANRGDPGLKNNPQYFDFSGNSEVDVVDVQALFAEITS